MGKHGRRVVALTKREQAYVAGVVINRFPCGREQRICASHKMHEKFLKEGCVESRRNSFGERILASDKPENLALWVTA